MKEVISDLDYLFKEENYIIEEIKENIYFIFQYKGRKITFILDEIDDDVKISYDSLSEYMKKIIDDNQLILGIDLGTTYSCAAVMIDKNIIIIRNSIGSTTTPSYISFMSQNNVYVGELAKLLPSNEKNVIFNTKRLLGKNIEDKEIKEMIKNLPFSLKTDEKLNLLKIVMNFNDKPNIEEDFYPEQICALILKKNNKRFRILFI